MRVAKVSSRRTGEAIDVECIKKKSGATHVFHQLPRDDSLSLRSVSPPSGPKIGMVLRDKGGTKLCHSCSFLKVQFGYMHHFLEVKPSDSIRYHIRIVWNILVPHTCLFHAENLACE